MAQYAKTRQPHFTTPATFTAADVPACSEITLSAGEAAPLRNALAHRPGLDGPTCQPQLAELRADLPSILPPDLLLELEYEHRAVAPTGVIKITGLPRESVLKVPLPGEDKAVGKPTHLSENLLCAVGLVFGHPYAVSTESGKLINDLIPSKAHLRQQTGLGSQVELGLHVENAAARFLNGVDQSPTMLLLLGVNAERNGSPKTVTADGRSALCLMLARGQEGEVGILREHRFIHKAPVRWQPALAGRHETAPSPVLEGPLHFPRITAALYGGLTRGADPKAQAALDAFAAALAEVAVGHEIEPGTMVLLRNEFVLHARTAFTPYFDAEGRASRWLQRIFVAESLRPFAGWVTNSDVVFDPKGG